jgi:hypothetical protein
VVGLLDSATQDVLRIGAVRATRFRPELRRWSTFEVHRRAALDTACDAGLLLERTIRFAHPLYREALRRSLTASRARAIHLEIARSLREKAGDHPIAMIASHYAESGGNIDPSSAVPVLVAAARQAEELFAWDEAVRYLGAALALRQHEPSDAETVDPSTGSGRLMCKRFGAGLEHLRSLITAEELDLPIHQIRAESMGCLRGGNSQNRVEMDTPISSESSSSETSAGARVRGLRAAQYRWVRTTTRW